jgi:hypothetical protein
LERIDHQERCCLIFRAPTRRASGQVPEGNNGPQPMGGNPASAIGSYFTQLPAMADTSGAAAGLLPLPILNLRSSLVGLGCRLRGGFPRVVFVLIRRLRSVSPPGGAFSGRPPRSTSLHYGKLDYRF